MSLLWSLRLLVISLRPISIGRTLIDPHSDPTPTLSSLLLGGGEGGQRGGDGGVGLAVVVVSLSLLRDKLAALTVLVLGGAGGERAQGEGGWGSRGGVHLSWIAVVV